LRGLSGRQRVGTEDAEDACDRGGGRTGERDERRELSYDDGVVVSLRLVQGDLYRGHLVQRRDACHRRNSGEHQHYGTHQDHDQRFPTTNDPVAAYDRRNLAVVDRRNGTDRIPERDEDVLLPGPLDGLRGPTGSLDYRAERDVCNDT